MAECLRALRTFRDSYHNDIDNNVPFCGATDQDRVFYPSDWRIRVWQACVAASAFVGTLVATFQAAFSTDYAIFWVLVYIFDIVYFSDMVLSFYRAYYNHNGILVTDRRKIIKRYLRRRFAYDLMCVLPLDVLAPGIHGESVAQALAFFRLNRIIKIYKTISWFGKLYMHLKRISTE